MLRLPSPGLDKAYTQNMTTELDDRERYMDTNEHFDWSIDDKRINKDIVGSKNYIILCVFFRFCISKRTSKATQSRCRQSLHADGYHEEKSWSIYGPMVRCAVRMIFRLTNAANGVVEVGKANGSMECGDKPLRDDSKT